VNQLLRHPADERFVVSAGYAADATHAASGCEWRSSTLTDLTVQQIGATTRPAAGRRRPAR
jgi:hypothetical protein